MVEPAIAVLASRTRVAEGAPDELARSLAAAIRAPLGVQTGRAPQQQTVTAIVGVATAAAAAALRGSTVTERIVVRQTVAVSNLQAACKEALEAEKILPGLFQDSTSGGHGLKLSRLKLMH